MFCHTMRQHMDFCTDLCLCFQVIRYRPSNGIKGPKLLFKDAVCQTVIIDEQDSAFKVRPYDDLSAILNYFLIKEGNSLHFN